MAAKKSVDEYIAGLPDWQVELVTGLRSLVLDAAPDAKVSIKWGQPVFEDHGPFAYIRPATNHVTFGFWRGTEIPDPNHLLEGDGNRMRHVKLSRAADIKTKELQDYVRTAVELNRTLGNPTKRE